MDPIILFLVLFVVGVILFSSGVYLAFYKRKIVGEPQPPAWMANLPEPARSVRLKEFNKQINKVFTWKWFLEYWRGQRSPFNAWFTWTFFGTWLLFLIGVSVAAVFLDAGNTQLMAEIFVIIFFLYTTIAAIILWRCAVNTTIFYKYFARIFAVYMIYIELSRLISIIRYSL